MNSSLISEVTTPSGDSLQELCRRLSEASPNRQDTSLWPGRQLDWCGEANVFRWFVPLEFDGLAWTDADLLAAYVGIGASCLTTSFVITQRSAAVRRIVASPGDFVRQKLLVDLSRGRTFATVGISNLSTSRRHLAKPAMLAAFDGQSVRLDGYTAWVTGAVHADTIVIGAETAGGEQLMIAVDRGLPGVDCQPPQQLVALTASCTGSVRCDSVIVEREWIIAGPESQLPGGSTGGAAGGLPTSALAIGLAASAIDCIGQQAQRRATLAEPYDALATEWRQRYAQLISTAKGESAVSQNDLRAAANSLVLRSTQAALAAVKGAGYVDSHAVGRWCREALFFLVWSCPQGVIDANLCELADIDRPAGQNDRRYATRKNQRHLASAFGPAPARLRCLVYRTQRQRQEYDRQWR